MGSWHFFIPLPDRVPRKDGRCYVRRPSGLSEGQTGPRFTPDGVCIVTHSGISDIVSNPELEAVWAAISDRCKVQTSQTDLGPGTTREFAVAEIVVSKQLAYNSAALDSLEDQLTVAFEFALSRLNQWLGAVSLTAEQSITKVRREELPYQLPFGEGPLEPWELETYGLGPVQIAGEFIVNSNFTNQGHSNVLPVEFDYWIDAALLNIDVPGPFVRARELQSQADVYRRMSGDYKVAIILYATACESLVDDLLQHLYWERGLPPHEAAECFINRRRKSNFVQPKSIKTLVTNDLYQLLTGNSWRVQKHPVIENWLLQVVSVRNEIVHHAKEPTFLEMVGCEESMDNFHHFLADAVYRLRDKYPVTALAYLGEGYLVRHGDWERFQNCERSLDQVRDRFERFRRWSTHLAALRKDPMLFGSKAIPQHGSAHVIFRDGVAAQAHVVHENETVCLELPLEQARTYEAFTKLLEAEIPPDEFAVVKYQENGGFQLPAGAKWDLYTYEAIRPFSIEAPRFQFE